MYARDDHRLLKARIGFSQELENIEAIVSRGTSASPDEAIAIPAVVIIDTTYIAVSKIHNSLCTLVSMYLVIA